METMAPDYMFADALYAALVEMGALAFAAPPPRYVPRLDGVRYDATQHRLLSTVYRKRGGVAYQHYVGSGLPTWEEEKRLHAAWLKKSKEIDDARS